MRAVVTGGTGFIGSHVVDRLCARGDEVVVVDIQPPGAFWQVPAAAKIYNMDVASAACEDLIAEFRPSVIFHLAARASVVESVQNPFEDARTTVTGTLRVLEGARRAKACKVVFSSTAAVYGNPDAPLPLVEDTPTDPISPYGVSKLAAERYLRVYKELHQVDFAVLRYANVYGPRQGVTGEGGVIAIFTKAALRGEPLRLYGDGLHTRDYVLVHDVACANLLAADRSGSFLLNISTGLETSNRRLTELVAAASGRELDVREESERPGDIRRSALSPTLATSSIGFAAKYQIDEGLRETYQWMLNWSADGS